MATFHYREISNYTIAEADTVKELITAVNNLMASWWRPIGWPVQKTYGTVFNLWT